MATENAPEFVITDELAQKIDRVLDVRAAAAARAGGHGDRYTVRIGGQITYLFFEHAVNGDGAANARDALQISRYAAGKSSVFDVMD